VCGVLDPCHDLARGHRGSGTAPVPPAR
jgi:hypothetical protein